MILSACNGDVTDSNSTLNSNNNPMSKKST